MKTHLLLAGTLIALFTAFGTVSAQDKTIVLVRHVEKDSSPTADKADPEISAEGKARADRLAKVVKRYKPHEIFSTPYKRTRGTAEPIAKRRKKEIQNYDPSKPAILVDRIMDPASKTEHYLVVGHSNTIPSLANLIAKKEIFRNLLETEYGVIWVIRIRKGQLSRVEVHPY